MAEKKRQAHTARTGNTVRQAARAALQATPPKGGHAVRQPLQRALGGRLHRRRLHQEAVTLPGRRLHLEVVTLPEIPMYLKEKGEGDSTERWSHNPAGDSTRRRSRCQRLERRVSLKKGKATPPKGGHTTRQATPPRGGHSAREPIRESVCGKYRRLVSGTYKCSLDTHWPIDMVLVLIGGSNS